MTRKALVICSGGIDSTVMLYDALSKYDKVVALTFSYGAKHNKMEYGRLKELCESLEIELIKIDLDFFTKNFKSELINGQFNAVVKDTDYIVPFRNGIMLSIAAGVADSNDIDDILIGVHDNDTATFPDCTSDFIGYMKKAVQYGTSNKIQLIAPFYNIRKADVIKKGHDLDVDFTKTYSCYKGGNIHCGVCKTCIERKAAFKEAGIEDLTEYEK